MLRRIGLSLAASASMLAGHASAQISNTSLQNKVIVGYQGWFACQGDGSLRNDWNHWQINKGGGRIIPATDIWPKMGEYTVTYNNNWTLQSGQPASVFSSYDASTVALHFKWMKDFGIDGAFVGRQTKTIAVGGSSKEFRDKVLKNVAQAAVTHGRVFYINYDISEEDSYLVDSNVNGNVFDRIAADFSNVYNNVLTSAERGRYVTINGKPLIRIFGVGSPRNIREDDVKIFDATQARNKLDTLNNSYTIMLGVNARWRTLDSTNIREDWTGTQAERDAAMLVWQQANYIQPWSINFFNNTTNADNYYRNRLRDDIVWGKAQSPVVNISPVIWPGFSWRNLKDGGTTSSPIPYNSVARGNGTFYWNNGYEAIDSLLDNTAPVKTITVAMFDEIDEGTGIMKVETNANNTPAAGSFSNLNVAEPGTTNKVARFITDVGGPNHQSDYFLWLTQQLKLDLSGSTPDPALPVR